MEWHSNSSRVSRKVRQTGTPVGSADRQVNRGAISSTLPVKVKCSKQLPTSTTLSKQLTTEQFSPGRKAVRLNTSRPARLPTLPI